MPDLVFTGERIVPGVTPAGIFREHEMRYRFAGDFVRDGLVVDVASGTGLGTDLLMKFGARACIGLELDFEAAACAASFYDRCQFAVCDATLTCLRGECADVVVSFETIEHLTDPAKFLEECKRLLRPGGLFICSTPNREVHRWHASNPFHVHEFFPHEFIQLVNQFFSSCRVYGQGEVVFALHVSRVLLTRFLELIHFKERLKQLLRRPTSTAPETEFSETSRHSEYEIKPYYSGWLWKPPYMIVVARKV